MFVDQAQIYVTGGNGGHGGMSFRREKYIPNGGPDGGNGGRGGNVILQATGRLRTLAPFKYKKKYRAESGENGTGGRCAGKMGQDITVEVPVGTVIKDRTTGQIIGDLNADGDTCVVAEGGRGGLGNMNFSNSTRQAPRFAQGGTKGQQRTLLLELKLLADVGLLGFPNVGKSTFLSVVTRAKPKIANYPFTTLIPNLGVVEWKDFDTFVIADIPGIIEGASQGVGLGYEFLRHVERTKMLIHILDVSGQEGRDPLEDFEKINEELAAYNADLAGRKQIVALNKTDITPEERVAEVAAAIEELGYEVFPISAATGQGLDALLGRTIALLDELPAPEIHLETPESEEALFTMKKDEPAFSIHRDGDVYTVEAPFLEQLINSVNFDDLDSVGYFQRRLKDAGIFAELERMGIQEEDTVRLEDIEFEYFK